MRYGDETGLFWDEPVRVSGRVRPEDRPLPPIPESDWELPEGPWLFPDLSHAKEIAIDIETRDPDLRTLGAGTRRDGYICGVSIGTDDGFRQYYPIAHEMGVNLPKERVFAWLSEQLNRPNQPKIGANLMYDLDYLTHAGVKIQGPFWDVQNAEPLIDEHNFSYSLERIAQTHLGEGKVEDSMGQWLKDAFGEKGMKGNIWRAPAQVVGPYAEGDVDLPLKIFAKQRKLLEAPLAGGDSGWKLFRDLESPLIPVLLKMKQRGVRVDEDRAALLQKKYLTREHDAIRRIKELTKVVVDPHDSSAIAKAFMASGMSSNDIPLTAKTNAFSITAPWLESLGDHPVAQAVRDLRKCNKARTVFLESYILQNVVDGRIHGQFNQLRSDEGGTVSGRFSSSHPNLQNIPARDPEIGKDIRSLYLPEEGQEWAAIDYSSQEPRLTAHYAGIAKVTGGDEIVQAYNENPNLDMHQWVADLCGVIRKDAKGINLGLTYGMGGGKLCEGLGLPTQQESFVNGRGKTITYLKAGEEGQAILDRYNTKAPFVGELAKKVKQLAEQRGWIRTLSGRIIHFPMENGERWYTHASLNRLIQGSAADQTKQSILDLDAAGHRILVTVHDENGLSVASKGEAEEAAKIMTTATPLLVPSKCDIEIGPSWGEAA